MEKLKRLIDKKVIYNGLFLGKIKKHEIKEQKGGSFQEIVNVDFDDFFIEDCLVNLKKNECLQFPKSIKFKVIDNVFIAIVNVRGKTHVGYAVYNGEDEKDSIFAQQLATYRALKNPNATAEEVESLIEDLMDVDLEDELCSLEDNITIATEKAKEQE